MEYPYVWELGVEFTQFSAVRHNEKYYTCISDHVASNSTEPVVGANWKTYWVLSSFNYLPKYNQGQEFFFPFFSSVMVPPQILNINPNSGSSCGGTSITITGLNFAPDAQVFFGLMVASNIVIVDSITITCTTPLHLGGGAVDVIVTQHTGASKITNGFTYTSTPQVINVNPNSGSSCGGTSVTIIGDNFAPSDQVFFDSVAAINITFVDCHTITCTTPIYPGGGVVDVSVVRGALIGTLHNGFTFIIVAPTISYTTQQMSCGGTQTLTASGGAGGPYTWHLASGGGTFLPPVGNTTLFTAPATNSNCSNNPQIYVTDGCGIASGTLKIAVNCYFIGDAFSIPSLFLGTLPCLTACGIGSPLTQTQIMNYYYDCSGNFTSHSTGTCAQCFCLSTLCGGTCFVAGSPSCEACIQAKIDIYCNHTWCPDGCTVGEVHDIRSVYQKSMGCCPAQLL